MCENSEEMNQSINEIKVFRCDDITKKRSFLIKKKKRQNETNI